MTTYPLPDGVEDGILNRSQVALAFNVSENTITSWVGKGMPVATAGDNGRAYEFQLSDCWSWKMERDAQEVRAKSEGDRIAMQAAQALLNLQGDEQPSDSMPPDEVRKWYRAEIDRVEALRRRGVYTSTARVKALVEGLIVGFRSAIITLPDYAERELGLPVEDVVKLEKRCNGVLDEARRLIEESQLGAAEVEDLRPDQGALL